MIGRFLRLLPQGFFRPNVLEIASAPFFVNSRSLVANLDSFRSERLLQRWSVGLQMMPSILASENMTTG